MASPQLVFARFTRAVDCPSFFIPKSKIQVYACNHTHIRTLLYANCNEKVYYAPREEKTWTIHISCKSRAKSEGGKHEMWASNFSPVERIILFFTIPELKKAHLRF